jgi:hypothetical protein
MMTDDEFINWEEADRPKTERNARLIALARRGAAVNAVEYGMSMKSQNIDI